MIDGTLYEGVRNIINGQAASAGATGYITRNFTTGRILFQLAGIPGAAFAMYRCAKPENRKKSFGNFHACSIYVNDGRCFRAI